MRVIVPARANASKRQHDFEAYPVTAEQFSATAVPVFLAAALGVATGLFTDWLKTRGEDISGRSAARLRPTGCLPPRTSGMTTTNIAPPISRQISAPYIKARQATQSSEAER